MAAATLALLAGGLVVAGPASAHFSPPQDGGSPNADSINTLYKFVLVVAVIIFVGVEGALFYSMIKFKARKGAVAAQIRATRAWRSAGPAGAALILVVLAVVTFIKLPSIRNPQDSGAQGFQASTGGVLIADSERRLPPNGKSLNIKVNGQQYLWRFTYPDGDKNILNNPFAYEEMVVPVDTAITLDINAQDVDHSWWIPELGGKFDAIPGYTNHTWFKIPAKLAGHTFHGECAELCGRNHANMIADVKGGHPAAVRGLHRPAQADVKAADADGRQAARPGREADRPVRRHPVEDLPWPRSRPPTASPRTRWCRCPRSSRTTSSARARGGPPG